MFKIQWSLNNFISWFWLLSKLYWHHCYTEAAPKNFRIDAFEMWCWGRRLRIPYTAGRSNQSILKEINPEYSLEGLMLKLKFQYFGQLTQRADLLEKALTLGKIEGRRRSGQQKTRWLAGITDSMDMTLSKLWETVKDREALCATVQRIRHNQVTE